MRGLCPALPAVFAALVSVSCVVVPYDLSRASRSFKKPNDGGGAAVDTRDRAPVPRLAAQVQCVHASAPGMPLVPELLLAAGEDSWLSPGPGGDVPHPEAEPGAGGTTLRVAIGLGAPGGGEVGSADGTSLPTYADVWTNSFTLDVAAEFGGGGKKRPFARLSISKLYSKVWENPSDKYDVWQASEATALAFSGGVRFGGGGDWKPYARLGAGIFVWPETSREDLLTGESTPMFASKAGFALALGGGVEMGLVALAGYKGFVDLDFWIASAPEAAPGIEQVWPGFEAGGSLGLLTLTTGLKIAF